MKPIFIGLGVIFLSVGVVGIVMPLLPTVPFFLASATCFAKGSEKLHKRLVCSNFYKCNVEPIVTDEGMTLLKKTKILSVVTLIFGVSIFFIKHLHFRAVLFIVLFFHYYYFIFKVKSRKEHS